MTYRKLLAQSLFAYATYHAVTTYRQFDQIHPFSSFGWVNEQFAISLFLAAFGMVFMLGARESHDQSTHPGTDLSAALSLSAASMTIFLRYFSVSAAAFTLCGLLEGMLVSRGLTRRNRRIWRLSFATCSVLFLFALSLISTSFFWVGN